MPSARTSQSMRLACRVLACAHLRNERFWDFSRCAHTQRRACREDFTKDRMIKKIKNSRIFIGQIVDICYNVSAYMLQCVLVTNDLCKVRKHGKEGIRNEKSF